MEIKLMTFNVEWMANFFVTGKAEFFVGKSLFTGMGGKPKNVQMVCDKIAGVISDIDADIIGIQEGPPLKSQMELFVKVHLNNKYHVHSMEHGRQSIHVLIKKNLPVQIKQLKEDHNIYKHLSRKIEYYTWDDIQKKKRQNFTRKPVVLELTHGGEKVEIMVFHTKSKISKLRNVKDWENKDKPKIFDALRSRQKLSQELAAIRRYIGHAIMSKRVQGIILMGDLNDGPNRDVFENEFLIHNILDELRGGFHRESSLMHHCLSQKQLLSSDAFTSDFDDPTQGKKNIRLLLDHILYSTALVNKQSKFQLKKTKSKIEHEVYQKFLTNSGKKRDERPSDHIPMTSILEIKV